MKRIYWYSSITAVLLIVMFGLGRFFSLPAEYQDLTDLKLLSVQEESKFQFDLKPYTVVLGWAEWCKTCMESIPFYNELHAKHKKNFQFYGIHFDPIAHEELKDLTEKHHITFPAYRIEKTPKSIWKIGKVPYMLIFSKKGTLLAEYIEGNNKANVESLMQKLEEVLE